MATSLKINERFKKIDNELKVTSSKSYQEYMVKQYIFDKKQYFYEQYIAKKISKDSINTILKNEKATLLNQIKEKTDNAINVFMGLNKDSTFDIIPDINHNNNFNDDKIYLFKKNENFRINISLDYVSKRKKITTDFEFDLIPFSESIKYSDDSNTDWNLLLRSVNSKFASFKLNGHRYNLEIIPHSLRDLYKPNNVRINFSEPDSNLKNIDFIKTLLFSPKLDTIISGEYKFFIDSLEEFGRKVFIKFEAVSKRRIGYQPGYNIQNQFLKILKNSTLNIVNFKSLVSSNKYILLDFWGTWCTPCIKNFPALKQLEEKFHNKGLFTLGLACEYDESLQKIDAILTKNDITWPNAFILKDDSQTWDITDQLKINSFPTYILLNNNLKILIRHSGIDGIEKITSFLDKNLK